MTSKKATWWSAVLALLAGLVLFTWRSGQTSGPPSVRPTNSRPLAATTGETTSIATDELSSSSEPDSVADQKSSAFITRMTAQLRAWADDENPELREQRTEELEKLLGQDNRNKIDTRLAIIAKLPAELMDLAFGLPSFQQWMTSEPKAAADWMSSHPTISEARLLTLFQNWAQKNRAELRQYLTALPESEWKQKAVTAASYEALPGNPTEAITWASQINADGPQTGLLKMATVEWAKHDPVEASRWVNQVRDLPLQENLMGSLAIGFADTDPILAGNWLLEAMGPGDIRTRSLAEITNLWSSRDPIAAREWIGRLSTSLPKTQVEELLAALRTASDTGLGKD